MNIPITPTRAPLRIAVDITPTVGHGYGVGRYVVDLLDGLIALNREAQPHERVELFGVYQGHHGTPPKEVIARCVSVHRYDLIGGRVGAWLRLPWILRHINAAVYHSTSTIAIPGPGWHGRSVVTIQDCYPLHDGAAVTTRHRRLFRQLLTRILTRADQVIVPSDCTKRDVLGQGYRGPVTVTPYGVTPPTIRPQPTEAPAHYILTVSAIEPRKGFDLLANALLTYDQPPPPWIHIGGVRYDPDGTTAALMDRCGCRRLGWVDGVVREAWLQHATVLACPSRLEGYGYPLVEGMAAGVAVVATEGGSQGEILGPDWEPCAPPDLARDIHALFNDEALRQERIQRGRSRAALLTLAATAAQTLGVYRRCIVGH